MSWSEVRVSDAGREFSLPSVVDAHSGFTVVRPTPRKESVQVKAQRKTVAGFAAAAAIVGIGGGFAAAHAIGGASPVVTFVQGPAPAIATPGPSNGPDVPGQPDLPEPGDVPDAPGQ